MKVICHKEIIELKVGEVYNVVEVCKDPCTNENIYRLDVVGNKYHGFYSKKYVMTTAAYRKLKLEKINGV